MSIGILKRTGLPQATALKPLAEIQPVAEVSQPVAESSQPVAEAPEAPVSFFSRIFFSILLALFFIPGFSQAISTSLTYSMVQPNVKTARPPVLIVMHGYGANENDFLGLAKSFDGRFATFCLRAPNAMQAGSYNWFNLDRLPNGDFKYDYGEIKRSRDQVLSFISAACKTHGLDSTQVYLMGFSQGTMMSYELALYAPSKIKGVLALSGRVVSESRLHAAKPGDLSRIKFFIAHGTADERIKVAEAEKALAFLKEKKVAGLTYKTYPMPHTVTDEEVTDMKAWMAESLEASK